MDPVEEFNFKPITEGLGFHRKKVELKEQMKSAKVVHEAIGKTAPVPTSTAKVKGDAPILKTPLPKKDGIPSGATATIAPNPTKDVIDEIARSFKKSNETFVEESVTPKLIINPTKPLIDEASYPQPWMLSPFFVDAMLVIALVLSGLLVTLLITNVDLMKLLMEGPPDAQLLLTFPAIVVAMATTYMTLGRLFLGASIGEIVFDLQAGTEDMRKSRAYGLRVCLRTFLAVVTGFFIVPTISMIARKDYLGSMSGLELYNRKRRR